MFFSRDRLKMLGLVLLCASLALAIILPAVGIQHVERDGFITGETTTEIEQPGKGRIQIKNLPVWAVMAGSGLIGFGLWIMADFVRPDREKSEGRFKRKRG